MSLPGTHYRVLSLFLVTSLGFGCAPDTPVQMLYDVMRMEQVQPNDCIVSFRKVDEIVSNTVCFVNRGVADQMVRLMLDHEVLIVHPTQHIYVIEYDDWIPAKALKTNEHLYSLSGEYIAIKEVQQLNGNYDLYRIVVEPDHTYFIGKTAIWVHNDATLPLTLMAVTASTGPAAPALMSAAVCVGIVCYSIPRLQTYCARYKTFAAQSKLRNSVSEEAYKYFCEHAEEIFQRYTVRSLNDLLPKQWEDLLTYLQAQTSAEQVVFLATLCTDKPTITPKVKQSRTQLMEQAHQETLHKEELATVANKSTAEIVAELRKGIPLDQSVPTNIIVGTDARDSVLHFDADIGNNTVVRPTPCFRLLTLHDVKGLWSYTPSRSGTDAARKKSSKKIEEECMCRCHDLHIGTQAPLCTICPRPPQIHPYGLYRAKADHHKNSRGSSHGGKSQGPNNRHGQRLLDRSFPLPDGKTRFAIDLFCGLFVRIYPSGDTSWHGFYVTWDDLNDPDQNAIKKVCKQITASGRILAP